MSSTSTSMKNAVRTSNAFRHVLPPGLSRVNRGEQLLARVVLEDVAQDTKEESPLGHRPVIVHRHKNDAGVRLSFEDDARRGQAVETWHADIAHNHSRCQRFDGGDEAQSVVHDIDDVALDFEQTAQLPRHGLVVLGDQHPQPHAMPLTPVTWFVRPCNQSLT